MSNVLFGVYRRKTVLFSLRRIRRMGDLTFATSKAM
jgi:hypothetical protein